MLLWHRLSKLGLMLLGALNRKSPFPLLLYSITAVEEHIPLHPAVISFSCGYYTTFSLQFLFEYF